MQVEITVNYDVPADEFDVLGAAYPLGKYISNTLDNRVSWFKLEIPGDKHNITLTWFKSWLD